MSKYKSNHRPYGPYEKYLKRPFDFIFALLALIVLSPILLITYILVVIFLGFPGIFRQPRPGKNEKIFNLYKFRTMTNAKGKNGKLLPDEKRLTKFSRLLRSTSLDELPELLNILRGDMSFIGPRPMLVRDLVFFDKKTLKRQTIMPGLTGLAQSSGRNSLTWDERFRYDLQYVEKVSFCHDAHIVLMTIGSVLKREGIGENNTDVSLDYGDYLLKNKTITKSQYDAKQKAAENILANVRSFNRLSLDARRAMYENS